MVKQLQNKIFHYIHGNRLIYNTCWEDPRIDRKLLNLGPESSVVVITSAGCNVLDYLLDGPEAIYAVDVNFRQNALLCLKIALIQHGDHNLLFSLFGNGRAPAYRHIYYAVRPKLPGWAQEYWDAKIDYFRPGGVRKSFYWRGAAGDFAWLLHTLLLGLKRLGRSVQAMLQARTLEEQITIYRQIEPHLFRRGLTWLLRQPAALAFVGVPNPQIQLIEDHYPGGLAHYIQKNLERVFTTIPCRDNYFWWVYLTGSYTTDCCPGYLLPENLPILQKYIHRVTVHTATVTQFLQKSPGKYSHFVLLDHQDWLAWHDTDLLLEEWHEIFQNSRRGAKILLRSAGPDLRFLPETVTSRLQFFPELTQPLHEQDRVGTYGSFHLAEVI